MAPANRFIFRGKNTRAVTAAGRALQRVVFSDDPTLSFPSLSPSLSFFFRPLLFRFDGRCRSTTAAGTRLYRREKKLYIYNIKNIRLRAPLPRTPTTAYN